MPTTAKLYLGSVQIGGGGGVLPGVDFVIDDGGGDWSVASDSDGTTGSVLVHRGANASALSGITTVAGVVASSTALSAVIASPTAMAAMAGSFSAMAKIAASSTAMAAVIASPAAMAAVVASRPAMTAIAASSTAMAAILGSASAFATVLSNAGAAAIMWSSAPATAIIWPGKLGSSAVTATVVADAPTDYYGGNSLKLSGGTTNSYIPNARYLTIDLTSASTLSVWIKASGLIGMVSVNGTPLSSAISGSSWTKYSWSVASYSGACNVQFQGYSSASFTVNYTGLTLA